MPCPLRILAIPLIALTHLSATSSSKKKKKEHGGDDGTNSSNSPSSTTYYLLTGDIGGTNSRMSLYAADSPCDCDEPIVVKYYRNAEHLPESVHHQRDAFQRHVVAPFLKYCWETKSDVLADLDDSEIVACLATAGLVTDNGVRMTNLGNLLVDGRAIESDTDDPYLKKVSTCRVINDFVAQGYGCLTLKEDEVELLHGPPDALERMVAGQLRGPKVCVGAGTGLGECYLTPYPDGDNNDDSSSYQCFPSEGGHVEFAPRNDLEIKLWKYLVDKYCGTNRISVERIVSGKGLANVYEFLAHEFPEQIDKAVHAEFVYAGDEQGKVVGVNASKSGSLCHQAMSIMISAYGCEVGSAAMKWIPTGGLFVTGGLTPKNMHFIRGSDSDFIGAYRNKGRVSPLLDKVPLFAVLTEDLGVRGAHKAAKTIYEHRRSGGSGDQRNSRSVLLSAVGLLQDNAAILTATAAVSFAAGLFLHNLRHHRH